MNGFSGTLPTTSLMASSTRSFILDSTGSFGLEVGLVGLGPGDLDELGAPVFDLESNRKLLELDLDFDTENPLTFLGDSGISSKRKQHLKSKSWSKTIMIFVT